MGRSQRARQERTLGDYGVTMAVKGVGAGTDAQIARFVHAANRHSKKYPSTEEAVEGFLEWAEHECFPHGIDTEGDDDETEEDDEEPTQRYSDDFAESDDGGEAAGDDGEAPAAAAADRRPPNGHNGGQRREAQAQEGHNQEGGEPRNNDAGGEEAAAGGEGREDEDREEDGDEDYVEEADEEDDEDGEESDSDSEAADGADGARQEADERPRYQSRMWQELSEAETEAEARGAFGKRGGRLIRIPKQARSQVQDAVRPYLVAFAREAGKDADERDEALMRKALMRFQTALSTIATRGDKGGKRSRRVRATRNVARQFRKFDEGHPEGDFRQPEGERGGDGPDTEEQAKERAARDAMKLAGAGYIGRAAAVMSRGKIATMDEGTLKQLGDKHPKRRGGVTEAIKKVREDLERDHKAELDAHVVQVDKEDLKKMIKGMCKGAAPGPTGVRPEHLRSIMQDDDCAEGVAAMVYVLASGQLGEDGWERVQALMLACRLVALQKEGGGVRPIAMGNTLLKVVEKVALLSGEVKEAFEAELLEVLDPPNVPRRGRKNKVAQYVLAKGGAQTAAVVLQAVIDGAVQQHRRSRVAAQEAGDQADEQDGGDDEEDDDGAADGAEAGEERHDQDDRPVSLSIDLANAFNSCDRRRIMQRLARQRKFYGTVRLVDSLLRPEAELWVNGGVPEEGKGVVSSDGVRQGAPASPALFALVIQDVFQEALEECLYTRAVLLADDSNIVGPADEVLKAWQVVQAKIESATGCKINKKKTQLVMLDGVAVIDREDAADRKADLEAAAVSMAARFGIEEQCIKFKAYKTLGVGVGVMDEMLNNGSTELANELEAVLAKVWQKTHAKVHRMMERMAGLPDPFTLQVYQLIVRAVPAVVAGYLTRNTPGCLVLPHVRKMDKMVKEEFTKRMGLTAVSAVTRRLFDTKQLLGTPLKYGGLGLRQHAPVLAVANVARVAEEATLEQVHSLVAGVGNNKYGIVLTTDSVCKAVKDMSRKELWLSGSAKEKIDKAVREYERNPTGVLTALKEAIGDEMKQFAVNEKEMSKAAGDDKAGSGLRRRSLYKFQHVYSQRVELRRWRDLLASRGGEVPKHMRLEPEPKLSKRELKEKKDNDKKKMAEARKTKYEEMVSAQPELWKRNKDVVDMMLAHAMAVAAKDTALVFTACPDSIYTECSNAAMVVAVLVRLFLPMAKAEECLAAGRRGGGNVPERRVGEHEVCLDCAERPAMEAGIGHKPVDAFPMHARTCPVARKNGNYATHGRIQRAFVQCLRGSGVVMSVTEDPGKAMVPVACREEARREADNDRSTWPNGPNGRPPRADRNVTYTVEPDVFAADGKKAGWFDVSVTDPASKSHCRTVANQKMKGVDNPAARAREREKIRKYEVVRHYFDGKDALGVQGRSIEFVPVVMEVTGAFGGKLTAFLKSMHGKPTWSGNVDKHFVQNTKRRMAVALNEGLAATAMRAVWRRMHNNTFARKQASYYARYGDGYRPRSDARRRLAASHAGAG